VDLNRSGVSEFKEGQSPYSPTSNLMAKFGLANQEKLINSNLTQSKCLESNTTADVSQSFNNSSFSTTPNKSLNNLTTLSKLADRKYSTDLM
jgi:hypothetical protein